MDLEHPNFHALLGGVGGVGDEEDRYGHFRKLLVSVWESQKEE